jgi:hypothetical protein
LFPIIRTQAILRFANARISYFFACEAELSYHGADLAKHLSALTNRFGVAENALKLGNYLPASTLMAFHDTAKDVIRAPNTLVSFDL